MVVRSVLRAIALLLGPVTEVLTGVPGSGGPD